MECFVFLMPRRWQRRIGYRPLTAAVDGDDASSSSSWVTVVVGIGKEKRVFLVDPIVLEKHPFRVLLGMGMKESSEDEKGSKSRKEEDDDAIYIAVDAILFEHMLWLMHNDHSSLFQLKVEEIIDFYAQDY
ncbi:hypothetical protein ACLOJK_028920 [Asimina triloba]